MAKGMGGGYEQTHEGTSYEGMGGSYEQTHEGTPYEGMGIVMSRRMRRHSTKA